MLRTQEQVLTQFDEWARGNDLVRAAILTSTRANPEREADFLSDYDIELYVADLGPFQTDDLWLAPFGPIMVRWPLKPRSTFDEKWITRGIIFRNGVRIDFLITDLPAIASDAYDDDYRVLIDKDGLTSNLNPPTRVRYLVKKPTKDEYETLVNEFWWDAHYVPKCLWRDELPFAASMLGQAVRDNYLRTIIEWFIGLQNDWSVNTGVRGRKFKRHLDGKTWSEYESTFAGPGIEENWEAFFNAVDLFRKLARAVGKSLDYEYPSQVDREMTEYYSRIRSTKKDMPNQNI
ncbi:aminoglycoside 6-adenylyltransferase [Candidatus Hydrogenedentota bacterium]